MNEQEAFELILPTLQHEGSRYVIDSRRTYEVDGVAYHEFIVIYFTDDDVLEKWCEGRSDEEREFLIMFFKVEGHHVRIVVDERGSIRRESINVS